MPTFSYTARNMQGEVEQGLLEAASTQDARAELVERGLLVEKLSEQEQPSPTIDSLSTPVSSETTWKVEDEHIEQPLAEVSTNRTQDIVKEEIAAYFPFMQTLRLYAGWLMAWYAAIYLLGYYQQSRQLPFSFSYIENLYRSPLVLSFTLGAFLFLLFSTLYISTGRKKSLALLFSVLGVATFVVYKAFA